MKTLARHCIWLFCSGMKFQSVSYCMLHPLVSVCVAELEEGAPPFPQLMSQQMAYFSKALVEVNYRHESMSQSTMSHYFQLQNKQ